MGKEQIANTITVLDRGPLTDLATSLRSHTPGHPLDLRTPTAVELFSMARTTSQRILGALSHLEQASVQNRFDRNIFTAVRRDVLQQVRSDPVYTTADAFSKASGGNGLSVIAEAEKEAHADQLQPRDTVLERGGKTYSGVMARAIRLLTGVSEGNPLDLDTLAPLMYPEEMFTDTQRDKAYLYINTRVRDSLKKNPLEYKLTISRDRMSDQTFFEAHATKQIESEGKPKPSVSLQVHTGDEYIFLNNEFISLYERTGIPISRPVHDGLKILSFLNGHPGEWKTNQEIIADITKDEAPLKDGEAKERMGSAKRWLEKTLVIDGKPIVESIRNNGIFYYGIKNFDLAMTQADRPYAEVLDEALARDIRYVSKEEFEYTSRRVEQNDSITLPDGTFLEGNNARLAFLLLYYASRRLYYPHLEELLFDENQTDRPAMKNVLAVRKAFRKHLPEVTVEVSPAYGEAFVRAEGYDPRLAITDTFRKKQEETVFEPDAKPQENQQVKDAIVPLVELIPQGPSAPELTDEPVKIIVEPAMPISDLADEAATEIYRPLLDPLLEPHFYATMSHQDPELLRQQTTRIRNTVETIAGSINTPSWDLLFSSTLRTRFSKSNGMSNYATRLIHLGQTILHTRTTKPVGEIPDEITGVNSQRFTDLMDYLSVSVLHELIKHRITQLEKPQAVKSGPNREVTTVQVDPQDLKQWLSLGFRPGSPEFDALRQGVPLDVLQQWISDGEGPGTLNYKTKESEYLEARQRTGESTNGVTVETFGRSKTTEYEALKDQQRRTEEGLSSFEEERGLLPFRPIIRQLLRDIRDPNVQMRKIKYRRLDLTGLQEFITTPDQQAA